MQTFRGKPLAELTALDLRSVPDALLIGMLKFHCRWSGARSLLGQRDMVVAEARQRSLNHWTLTHLDPPRCACGGPGHYIVGETTYCRECRPQAVARLQRTVRKIHAQKQKALSDRRAAFDATARRNERLWKVKKRRHRRPD